jgi:hypothetical protein
MWEIMIFKQYMLLKTKINSQKPGFGRKIIEDVVINVYKYQLSLILMNVCRHSIFITFISNLIKCLR